MGKSKRSISRKEAELLKRNDELEYETDRLGPGSLMTQQSHVNSSRMIMVNHHMGHAVGVESPEPPLVSTGYENVLASFSSSLDKVDSDYEIVEKFVKNKYNYILVGFDRKNKRYHAWERTEMEEYSEGFAIRHDNSFVDSLEVGDVVTKDSYINKSVNFDKHMNYQYGKNLNVVYMVSPFVYEDGILAMNGVEKMMNTYRSHTIEMTLSDNEVLLNLFGKETYQGLPNVGEKTKNGFIGAIRRIDSSKAPYALKKKRLKNIERGDRKFYVSGRVIDITVLTNKERLKMVESGANEQLNAIYDHQQDYYKKVYRYMIDIVDGADDGGYTYTDEFTIICEFAHDFVDSSAFFADENDGVFGSTKIVCRVMDVDPMRVGSKLVGRYGNKGVISSILPEKESWVMEDGTPVHLAVSALGVVGRLNPAQLNEHSINELTAGVIADMKSTDDLDKKLKYVYKLMKYLNSDEAEAFKKYSDRLSGGEKAKYCRRIERDGIFIIQDPINNMDILDLEKVYDKYKPNYQRIVFPDGGRSMRKMLCAKGFFMRLKQDPVDKYSARSRGPVNPLTMLPAKSTLKRNYQSPFSDVAVRFGEMEAEILHTMVPHPAAIANFQMENSTSWEAKVAMSEQAYLGRPEDDIDISDVDITGKKNAELISAQLNVLGIEVDIDFESAKDGEMFDM